MTNESISKYEVQQNLVNSNWKYLFLYPTFQNN